MGGIESTSFSSPPPRQRIAPSPGTITGGYITTRESRPRGNSLCSGDNVSNMTTATDADATTWVGSDANNNNDGECNSSGCCDGASSRSSCQTVHHANLMRDGGIVSERGLTNNGGNNGGGGVAAVRESRSIHQQQPPSSSNPGNKKKRTPSKRPVSAIGDRMQHTSPTARPKSSAVDNGGHTMKNGTKHRMTTTMAPSSVEKGIATKSSNAVALDVSCREDASQHPFSPSHIPPPPPTATSSTASSTSSGPTHATTSAFVNPEASQSESRDSTLYSYFGASTSVLSSSNHAASTTSNPLMIRSNQQQLSPPMLHSKQPKMGNQRTLHSFLGISDKKQLQHSADQDEGKNVSANNEGGSGGLGIGASTSSSKPVTNFSSSSTSTSSSSSKKINVTSSTSTHESSEQQQQHQQQSLLREVKRLHAQLSNLQKQLEEANARNNSIKNNQTLTSANLQRQLKFVKAELEEVKLECNARQSKAMEAMETFVREESMREAKELRQTLASDGARLGRLISSRVGPHHHHHHHGGGMMGGLVRSSQSIETWEDGHAPKMIKLRRSELKVEKERLEKRMEDLVRAFQNEEGYRRPDSAVPNVQAGDSLVVENELSNISNSGTASNIKSDLDRMEAMETVKMRLHEVEKKEMELDAEERALNIEKRAHVRALKLVSNEDSSKFRSRRKVRVH